MVIAIIIGVVTAIVLITFVVVVLARYTKRKNFASPLASKAPLAGAATAEKSGPSGNSYTSVTVDDNYNQPRGTMPADRRGLLAARADDYQEPYQALKYAPYYSYSPVVMEMKDMIRGSAPHSGQCNKHETYYILSFHQMHIFFKESVYS